MIGSLNFFYSSTYKLVLFRFHYSVTLRTIFYMHIIFFVRNNKELDKRTLLITIKFTKEKKMMRNIEELKFMYLIYVVDRKLIQ